MEKPIKVNYWHMLFNPFDETTDREDTELIDPEFGLELKELITARASSDSDDGS